MTSDPTAAFMIHVGDVVVSVLEGVTYGYRAEASREVVNNSIRCVVPKLAADRLIAGLQAEIRFETLNRYTDTPGSRDETEDIGALWYFVDDLRRDEIGRVPAYPSAAMFGLFEAVLQKHPTELEPHRPELFYAMFHLDEAPATT